MGMTSNNLETREFNNSIQSRGIPIFFRRQIWRRRMNYSQLQCKAVVLNCLELPTTFPFRKQQQECNVSIVFLDSHLAFIASKHDRTTVDQCKLQDELVITTEHTEKEPDFLLSSFRVFRVFRGSFIGSCIDRTMERTCFS
jgi:hypothetical protein